MVGNGMGAKNGILFKTAVSLEETGKVQIVALDKTGTITNGEPVVTDMVPAEGVTEESLLALAASLEKRSEHPLAKAILKYVGEQQLTVEDVSEFEALPGNGLTAVRNGVKLAGGNYTFIRTQTEAVSYTHLDVYKRQQYVCVICHDRCSGEGRYGDGHALYA